MFITLQYPLFDRRYAKEPHNRTDKPDWRQPGEKERIRYFGVMFGDETRYQGPWDGEKNFCNARSVINTCGMGDDHFYKLLFSAPAASRIAFRRFQSDGQFMARFEVGFNDYFEQLLAKENPTPQAAADAIYAQISRYLSCPVKIKTGNRLSAFVPLADAGSRLRSAYYWATQKGPKTFADKDIGNEVDNCTPVMLVHLNTTGLDTSAMNLQQVNIPGVTQNGLQLYYQYLPYQLNGQRYRIKTWFICSPNAADAVPRQQQGFQWFSDTVRNLRINLLRIHTEAILHNKLISLMDSSSAAPLLHDPAARNRLYQYLHKRLYNLSKMRSNGQPQDMLAKAALELNSRHHGGPSLEEQQAVMEQYSKWLETLEQRPGNEQVKNYVTQNTTALQQQAAAATPSVFISYNHNDSETVQWLKQQLEAAGIDVLLDSDDMPAGESITAFIHNCIKNTQTTLSVLSTKSLQSGWVGIETVNSIAFQRFFPEKKLIPCYTDTAFLENENFTDDTLAMLNAKIEDLKQRILQRKNAPTIDLDQKKQRLENLCAALPGIMAYFDEKLCIDMRPPVQQQHLPRLLAAIRGT